ncbi:hypothetical protein H2248_009191 [Termitomyces sp. 'cryptogamus']|nr:hypothetical protein H2248_009191 [Termitomyces sp. 'cryptogamus']
MTVFVPNGLLGPSQPTPTSGPSEDSNTNKGRMLTHNGASKSTRDSELNSVIESDLDSVLDFRNETCTFIPNGLLSSASSVTTESIDVNTKRSSVETDTLKLAFIPNGLLSSSNVTTKKLDDSRVASTEGLLEFIPNGLLSSAARITEQAMDAPSSATMPTLVPNGLLSKSSHRYEGNLFGGTSDSQDDDYLPSVHEAFGIPTTLIAAPSTSSTSATASNGTSSRFSIRATTFDGKPIHIKRKPKVSHVARDRLLASTTERMGNLLDVPIHRLMNQLSVSLAANIQERLVVSSSPSEPVEKTLWVDRYRPQRFTELTGNERVARETMAWVKRWDWCVFGSKKGRKRPRAGDENFDEMDEYHRPREKLLLLSGPPGLGKTTLAHVIAKQAGYDVMEINASDARSGSIVDDRIRPALESGSAVGSTKPVLLIIDEIDGATGAGDNSNTFISKLVSLTQDRPRKKRQKQKDPQAKRPILRPIICICNDQNASSLAKLKPHALQIRIQRPADIHTVNRLREICQLEGLKADSRALSTLVGVAKGDLRGCLNTLQFIKSRNQEVTEGIVRSATVGMKEGDTSLNAVLNNIFSPLAKKRVKELGLTDEEEARYVARLSREIDGSGRENSIALGCFGHYATLRQHDANFDRYEKANGWLVTFDFLSSSMYTNGDFALSPYLPYTLVPFYPLFQERGGTRVERNQEDWENLQLTRSNEEVLKTLSRGLRSASVHRGGDFRHLLSIPILQLEFVPFINRIISPPIRPVNSQVIKPQEKALLMRLVSIMAALELRFFQERAEDGQLSYRLDPPIDVFVTYDGKRASDIAVSRYAVRHLVAQEIDAVLIARDADIVEKGKRGKHEFGAKKSFSKQTQENRARDNTEDDRVEPPNKRLRTDDNIDIADKPPTDFFGRVITVGSSNNTNMDRNNAEPKKYHVTYRFTEGSSAAIRKPVKIAAFL